MKATREEWNYNQQSKKEKCLMASKPRREISGRKWHRIIEIGGENERRNPTAKEIDREIIEKKQWK